MFNLDTLALTMVALVPAITVHEWAHAYAAYRLGDPTAKRAGRLSLNPLVHLDTLGTLALILFKFGWGKPVPVNPTNFQKPLRDQALVSAAGPASNIVFAGCLVFLLKYAVAPLSALGLVLYLMVQINVVLAVFNMLPIYPLDGSKVLLYFFKNHQEKLLRFYQYSPSVLLGLLFGDFLLRSLSGFSVFGFVFGNISDFVQMLIFTTT